MSQNFFRATNKLRIANYFIDLKNKTDLLVEIYISDNQHDQVCIDEINNAREAWIKEADECQAYNLAALEMNENKDELVADEQLFKRFCFLINSNADLETTGCFTGRFISTDVYLRPGQIKCFQELLKFTSIKNYYLYEQMLFEQTSECYEEMLTKSLNTIFQSVKTYEDVSQYYLLDLKYQNNAFKLEFFFKFFKSIIKLSVYTRQTTQLTSSSTTWASSRCQARHCLHSQASKSALK
jgi:hypothetical protein